MANPKALSRLLSFREPKIQTPVAESIADPTDYDHKIKKRAYTPEGKVWLKRASFESPQVDYALLRQAMRTEPLFRRRNNRYQNLCWKNGYVLKTEDIAAQEYIASRMELFSALTGESFDSLLRKLSRELIMFDSCVVLERRVKVKDLQRMGVTLDLKGIGPLSKDGPVVAYEIIPIDTIQYKRDEFGNILRWKQVSPAGGEKEFSPEEIILIKNDEESGDILAFPSLQMVIPDARILRQLETDASLAAHRLAFPVFKYKVGDVAFPESLPRKDDNSITEVWYTLEGMLLDGALIIPGSDDFEVVLSDVKLDGLSSIIEYFKNRVILGSGLAPIHVGDSSNANRSVADRLDVQLYDDVKAYQKTISEVVTFSIYTKWLLEGGFNLKFGVNGLSESRVALEFREIDTDSLIKRENHTLAKWVQDLIGHDEARAEIGRTPLTDTSNLYSDLIGGVTAKYQAEVNKSKAQETAGGQDQKSNAKTRAKKTSAVENLAIDEDIKTFKQLADIFKQSLSSVTGSISKLDSLWDKIENEITLFVMQQFPEDASNFNSKDLQYASALFADDIITNTRFEISQSFDTGINRGFEEARDINPDIAPMKMTTFTKNINLVLGSLTKYYTSLLEDVFKRVEEEVKDSEIPYLGVEIAFASMHYRLVSILATHLVLAENWGVCMVAQHADYTQVWQESEPGCSVCKSGWVNTSQIELSKVPPFNTHPHCECRVHIRPTQ